MLGGGPSLGNVKHGPDVSIVSLVGRCPRARGHIVGIIQGFSCAIILVSGPVAFFLWLQGQWLCMGILVCPGQRGQGKFLHGLLLCSRPPHGGEEKVEMQLIAWPIEWFTHIFQLWPSSFWMLNSQWPAPYILWVKSKFLITAHKNLWYPALYFCLLSLYIFTELLGASQIIPHWAFARALYLLPQHGEHFLPGRNLSLTLSWQLHFCPSREVSPYSVLKMIS